VVKLADARDSKSRFLREVWVRLPPPAPSIQHVKTTGFLNVEWALRIGVLSAEKWRVRRHVRQGMANRLGRLESPGAVRGMGVRSRPCIRKSTFRLDLPQRFCHTSADCPVQPLGANRGILKRYANCTSCFDNAVDEHSSIMA
jgi:hypothetical protein